jgi:hypothetical protein
VDLRKLTLNQFLGIPNLTLTGSVVDQFGMMAALFKALVGEAWHDLGGGYFLHRLGADPANVAVVINGDFVGFYHSQVVAVDSAHGGMGLGTAMVLATAKYRNLPMARTLSPEGKATLTKAWNVANGSSQLALNTKGLG